MNNIKLGIIGAGNMAFAIASGVLNSALINPENIYVSDKDEKKLDAAKKLGINTSTDNAYVAENADIIILAVKPDIYDVVIKELAGFTENIYVSIAPGISIGYIKSLFKKDVTVVRCMPNTPALVGLGTTAICRDNRISDRDFKTVYDIFSSFGMCTEIREELMNKVVALNGSSPAYVYLVIDAVAKAAEKEGFNYSDALKMAANTVLGSAKMVLESSDSPEVLCDRVCSKGGTTIEAVKCLKNNNLYEIFEEAMKCCTKRAEELSK